tara:strand:- start:242 stop:922 length:681 start_codon:yes stop_codon:yes gene_type:complete
MVKYGDIIEDLTDYELKAAEVLAKGAGTACSNDGYVYPWHGLLNFLYNIFELNEGTISQDDFKVRPGYAYDKFYFNWVDGSYDMSLQGLIHHIMYEEKLYDLFLNKRQMKSVKHVVENHPESIYRPEYEPKLAKHEEENEFANYTLDLIYNIACKCIGQILLDVGCDVRIFTKAGYKIRKRSEYLIYNCVQLTISGESFIENKIKVNKLDEESLRFVYAVKQLLDS